jgi:hypothetical protein
MSAPLLISLPGPDKVNAAARKAFVLAAASAAIGTAPTGRYKHEIVMALPDHVRATLESVVARTDWSNGIYKLMFDKLYKCRVAKQVGTLSHL